MASLHSGVACRLARTKDSDPVSEAVIAAAVLLLTYAVAGGWWMVGLIVAYVIALAIDAVTE